MERKPGFRAFIVPVAVMLLVCGTVQVQSNDVFPFDIELVPVRIADMPGLHSYAFGQADGMWLLVGGRLDGLHSRQPVQAFPVSENNTNLYVVDTVGRRIWTASVLDLPTGLAEQLQSTDMNFYQDGRTLFVTGGYGYSASAGDYVTFPFFTAIDVMDVVSAVCNGDPVAPYIHQIAIDDFAVTGGQIGKIEGEFFLVGGHRFDGRYHPMGRMGVRQEYTNQIRVFTVHTVEGRLEVDLIREYTDTNHLRRRDYNLVPQIYPDGSDGYMISAGVFQPNADLPFLYPVDVTSSGYVPRQEFQQLLSNYHSPKLPLYDTESGEMHSIFFGGMAQYYYRSGELVRDDQVPFVNTISRVTRDADGLLTEYLLPLQMPGLLGAGGEFIPNPELLSAGSRVFRADDLGDGPIVVGHILGGIQSPTLNPFTMNRSDLTSAASSVYAVQLTRRPVVHRAVVSQ